MIQHAFTSAYTNQVSAQNQGINTITGGIKDAATLIGGVTAAVGGMGSGAVAQGFKHALAGRVGGVGGNIMLATLQQKKETAQQQTFTREEIGKTIASQLGDNPINRPAIKQLNTVFDTLIQAKESGMINEKGMIETSMGSLDPNTELGKKILGGK